MTINSLTLSSESAHGVAADALVIGLTEGPDGPVPAMGTADVDAALGGTLASTLAALGATGKQDEITKFISAGQLTAPLIVAAGLGKPDGADPLAQAEALRRAAGAAVRASPASDGAEC